MSVNNINAQQSLAAATLLSAATDLQQAEQADAAQAKLLPKADFDGRAEMHLHHHHHHLHKPLSRRPPPPSKQLKKGPQNVNQHNGEHDLDDAANIFLDQLHKNEEGGFKDEEFNPWETIFSNAQEKPDGLKKYSLLKEAKEQLGEKDLSPEIKEKINKTLDRMMDEEASRDPGVTANWEKTQVFGATVDAMAARSVERTGTESAELRNLRGMLGSQSKGKNDEPLSPIALVQSLQRVEDVDGALADLNVKFSGQMRKGSRNEAARMWLSVKDLHSIATVNTSYQIAGEMRRDLSEKAALTPKQGQMATAQSLLELAAEPGGKADAEKLLKQTTGGQKLNPQQRAAACAVLSKAVSSMPLHWWKQDRSQQRLELLTELRNTAVDAHMNLPVRAVPQDHVEKHLRTTFNQGIAVR